MFSSINSKYQAVVSQETPVLLECINLKGGEVSLAEAPFIQTQQQSRAEAVACQRMLCLSSFCDCSSDVCSSASSFQSKY